MVRVTRVWTVVAMAVLAGLAAGARGEVVVHVSPAGDDANPGTVDRPVRTPAKARDLARGRGAVTVSLAGGTYYLAEPLVLGPEDSGGGAGAEVRYVATAGERPVFSGAKRLPQLAWTAGAGGVMSAVVPAQVDVPFDQLVLDGKPLVLARYPNYDPAAKYLGGTAADAIAPARVKGWAHPETAILHALHASHWGDMHWRVTGVDAKGSAVLAGGHQNNRPSPPHKDIRYVENVREELDAPGEFYFDRAARTLHLIPPAGYDAARLAGAMIEAPALKHLIEVRGAAEKPVRFVRFEGITFAHAARTFMEAYEPLLRSDWRVYRGGAVLIEGAEDVAIADCEVAQIGGNGVFVSKYARRVAVSGCHFHDVGASCVLFVGDTAAVRMPGVKGYGDAIDWATLDRTPGPANTAYPSECRVSDCLMAHFGTIEKQVAGVDIDVASRITVSHCSIYDCPRAGINVGSGAFGGHLIEFNDVFDTVKETGDHGAFNSWGRDRFWRIKGKALEDAIREIPGLTTLDVVEPITLANNRWRCDHGWDIDLDDGSSNYRIVNNVCLAGGLKNREGFGRVVENNVVANGNGFHPHVWYRESGDVFRRNIVTGPHRPIGMKAWGKEVDRNSFADEASLTAARKNGTDANSVAGDPMFVDPAAGDFRVKAGSPALGVGFENFDMGQFGVASRRLKAIALRPAFGPAAKEKVVRDGKPRAFLGGTVRNVVGLGEQSAYGLPGEVGLIVVEAPAGSGLAAAGVKAGEVIRAVNGRNVESVRDVPRVEGAGMKLTVWRDQRGVEVTVPAPK